MFLQIIFIFCFIPKYVEPTKLPPSPSHLKRIAEASSSSSSKRAKVNENDKHYKNGPIILGQYPLFEPGTII